jgi:exodeoxyribonuclease-1
LTREDWRRLLFAKKDTLQEGEKRLPIYRINVSSCPFVCSNLKVLSDDRASKYGIDKDLCLRNSEILTEVIPKLGGAVTAQCERKEAQPADADVALYQKGFDCTRHDRDLKKRIASLSASELGEENAAFDDADFNELLFRSRGRNAPDTFDEVERRNWRKHCAETLRDGKGGVRTISQYFDEIDRLQEEHLDDETACEKLELLYEWGERLGENFSS